MKKVLSFFFFIGTALCCFAQNDTSRVEKIYSLGEVVISESNERQQVTAEEMEKYNSRDAANSLKILPSIVLSTFASRNESTIYLRGFDIRSVPVFIDGIPVYVPYDGYVDLARFTTYDISAMEVSKGFTPVNYGPNTLGGAINLVSMKPGKKLEINSLAGAMTGNGLESSLSLGSNQGRFYVRSDFSFLKKEYVRLSRSFTTGNNETDLTLDNSGREDIKFSIKLGYVPGRKSEYSINYLYSHGSKGNPVYTGNDPGTRPRYWKWPNWDKQSFYYISKTAVGEKSVLVARAYFDSFSNKVESFDDESYSTQEKKSSFDSYYNDYTIGSNFEFSSDVVRNNHMIFSAHIKNDNHSQHNNSDPAEHFADNTWSAGAQDVYRASSSLKLIPSVSYNIRQELRAGGFEYPENSSRALNAQFALDYKLAGHSDLNASIAWKNRFATMKDRYSYRLGTGIPNPFLKPEDALNLGLSYICKPSERLWLEPELFYNHLYNTIQLVSNVQDDLSQMQNTGESVFSGFELAAGFVPLSFLEIYSAYTYIKRKNLSNPEILFTDVPVHKVFASAELSVSEAVKIIFSGEYNSRRISSSDGTRSAPGYALGNLRLSTDILKHFRMEAGVNNILDKNYSIQEGYPEEGRNLYISLRFSFEE